MSINTLLTCAFIILRPPTHSSSVLFSSFIHQHTPHMCFSHPSSTNTLLTCAFYHPPTTNTLLTCAFIILRPHTHSLPVQDDDPAEDNPDDEDGAEEAHEDLAGHVARLSPLLLAVPPEAFPTPGVRARKDAAVVVGDVAAVRQEPSNAFPYRLTHTGRPVPVSYTHLTLPTMAVV